MENAQTSGPLLSKYRLNHQIGEGPSSLVYIATGKEDKKEYALRITLRHTKEVLPDRRIETRGLFTFDPRALDHPNILKYFHIYETEDLFVSVMTYCPGGCLEDFVLEPSNNYTNANLSRFLNRLAPLFNQITSACRYLHTEKKLIHGNIKLTNIFLKDAERFIAALGDLGTLKAEGYEEREKDDKSGYMGTSLYLAPEVIAGGPLSFKSDIYALGACVYVAIDSRGPFPGQHLSDYRELLEQSIAANPSRRILTLQDSSIQGPVCNFLDRTVSAQPDLRDTAEELLSHAWLADAGKYDGGGDASDRAPRLFITSDDGRDPDFEIGKVMVASMIRRQQLRIIGYVAGLAPAVTRARLCKGTLVELGLESIPVAAGEDRNVDDTEADPYEFSVPYLCAEEDLYAGTGLGLFREALLRSPDKTVTLVLQSGPMDAWKCLETYPHLFMRKVRRVVLRAAVQVVDGQLKLSENGQLLPDVASASKLDSNQMVAFFGLLQDVGIPMVVVTRFAGYAVSLGFDVYRAWGCTKHPVAQRLTRSNQHSIQSLWERCHYQADDPRRKELPARCDKEWFCNFFLVGKGMDRGPKDSILDLCTHFSSFSSLQLIAAVSDLENSNLFSPTVVKVRSKRGDMVTHKVLGLSSANHGINEPRELTSFLTNTLLTGFTGTDRVQQRLLIVSDDGKDLDDELAKVLMACLEERQLATCKAYIASLHPAALRARLAKGTLQQLGIDAEVGIGSAMGNSTSNAYEFDVDYLASEDQVLPSGVQLFVREMEAADDGLYTLVVLSGMRDAWDLLRDHTDLFRRKVSRVVIMGGVETQGNTVKMSEEGFLVPDTAANNAFDMDAAKNFYRELQRQNIPMTIVSRWAAYAAKLPLSLYDRMARTMHPVAVRLQKAQKSSLQHLWMRACLPAGDPGREGLPGRCDRPWFSNTFLSGRGQDRIGSDSIWDLSTTFQAYDCIALLGALPGIRDRYLDPMVFAVHGLHGVTVHEVMGMNAELNGVRDPRALCNWMEEAMLEGFTTDGVQKRPTARMPKERSGGSLQEHHVRAFAQTYATQAPKMKPQRLHLMTQKATTCFQRGSL